MRKKIDKCLIESIKNFPIHIISETFKNLGYLKSAVLSMPEETLVASRTEAKHWFSMISTLFPLSAASIIWQSSTYLKNTEKHQLQWRPLFCNSTRKSYKIRDWKFSEIWQSLTSWLFEQVGLLFRPSTRLWRSEFPREWRRRSFWLQKRCR